jgi:hypothetical protein
LGANRTSDSAKESDDDWSKLPGWRTKGTNSSADNQAYYPDRSAINEIHACSPTGF